MLDILPSEITPRYAFDKYDEVVIEGIAYQPMESSPSGHVLQQISGGRLAQGFTHSQLWRLAQAGKIKHNRGKFLPEAARRRVSVPTQVLSTLPPKKHQNAKIKEAMVLAFFHFEREGKVKRTESSIREVLPQIRLKAAEFLAVPSEWDERQLDKKVLIIPANMSERTLRRHVSSYEKLGIAGLFDKEGLRGNRQSRLGLEEQALMVPLINGFMDDRKPTAAQIYENVQTRFHEENVVRAEKGLHPLTCPSRETVRSAIKALDPYHTALARDGLEAARRKFAPVGKGVGSVRPLQRVEMDEWNVDIKTIMTATGLHEILTDEDKILLGLDGSKARWWLTVAICTTTRCILAMRLSRNPGSNSALQTLDMIMQDKGVWSDAVAALTPWHMSGTPELVVTDCGSAFTSYDTRMAAQNLGMRLEHAPAGLPEMRGQIERFFNTASSSLMGRLTGRTFGDIIEKGDYDPDAKAALSADDICNALIRWVVDKYHRTPHRGLDGETPIDCWDRLIEQYGVAPPADLTRRRLVFGTRDSRVVDKTGITVLGVRYHSELLARWFLHARETCVNIRWYAEDIGAIAVELDGEWIEVPSVFTRFSGVKAQTWLAAARHLRVATKRAAAQHQDVIFQAIADIEALNGDAMRRIGLVVQDWSKERLEKEEDRVFIGFAAGEERGEPATAPIVGWGEEVPSGTGTNLAAEAAFKPADEKISESSASNKRPVRRRVDPPQEGLPGEDDDFIFGKK